MMKLHFESDSTARVGGNLLCFDDMVTKFGKTFADQQEELLSEAGTLQTHRLGHAFRRAHRQAHRFASHITTCVHLRHTHVHLTTCVHPSRRAPHYLRAPHSPCTSLGVHLTQQAELLSEAGKLQTHRLGHAFRCAHRRAHSFAVHITTSVHLTCRATNSPCTSLLACTSLAVQLTRCAPHYSRAPHAPCN
jgi:hypothetical protein